MKEIKDLEIFLNGKKVIIPNILALGFFGKFRGLMFTPKFKSRTLLFNHAASKGIHSYFVFFDFLCIWLDSQNRVVDYKIVRPFQFYVKTSKNFDKILEIPINKENYKSLKSFKKI